MTMTVYTCQDCGKEDTDSDKFKMLEVLSIGFVICKECIMNWGD